MPRRFLFVPALFARSQRQRKEGPEHMGNIHPASWFSAMHCSIFSLAEAQQFS